MLPNRALTGDSLLVLGAGILVCMSAGSVVGAAVGETKSGFGAFLAGTLSFHGGSLLAVHIYLRVAGSSWGEAFGWAARKGGRVMALAAGLALLVLPLAWALCWASGVVMRWFFMEPMPQAAVMTVQSTADPVQLLVIVVLAVVLVPLAEEVLFRGIAYVALKDAFGRGWATVLTSTGFGVIHFNAMTFVALVVLAVMLVWLYETTENLLAPIAAHSLFNLANVVVLLG